MTLFEEAKKLQEDIKYMDLNEMQIAFQIEQNKSFIKALRIIEASEEVIKWRNILAIVIEDANTLAYRIAYEELNIAIKKLESIQI